MKTYQEFVSSYFQYMKEGMTTQSTDDKPGFSTFSDDRGPVAGRSPKLFFLSRTFAKKYSDGKPQDEKIWLDSFKKDKK